MRLRTAAVILFALTIPFTAVVPTCPAAPAGFPEHPIVCVVHTKPGGAMDLSARMVSAVARRHLPVPIVVENRYGGSGAVAMRSVLSRPADGYTLLAVPATFISTVQVTRAGVDLADFVFLACLIEAPESLITVREGELTTVATLSFAVPLIKRRVSKL